MAPGTAVEQLLTASEDLLGLPLCLHLPGRQSGVANRWRLHRTAPCLHQKSHDRAACRRFDSRETHAALQDLPAGRIHTCPAGFTEIAVPVQYEAEWLGVLFAGPVWTRRARPVHPALPVLRSRRALTARWQVLQAVALRLGQLLATASGEPEDRATAIRTFLLTHLAEPLRLADLAAALNLSASRTRHLVREETGKSFTTLLQQLRLREASRLLIITRDTIAAVAAQVGIPDQNYFARLFRQHYGIPPRVYRQRQAFPEDA